MDLKMKFLIALMIAVPQFSMASDVSDCLDTVARIQKKTSAKKSEPQTIQQLQDLCLSNRELVKLNVVFKRISLVQVQGTLAAYGFLDADIVVHIPRTSMAMFSFAVSAPEMNQLEKLVSEPFVTSFSAGVERN